jgi:3-oxoacyl-[acyl-carrier protein] reductase
VSLEGRVALVTGGSRGIGAAVAQGLAAAGIRAAGGEALGLAADVGQSADVERLVGACLERFGRLDILVNNAGMARDGLLVRMKDDDWTNVLAVNLTGAFYCARAVLRAILKQRQGGRIINIGSVVGSMGNAGQANYVTSKAGLIGLTKALAKEVATRGVTVNLVAPGFSETEMTASLPDSVKEAYRAQIPLGRFGTAADVAAAVSFLASEGAAYITGQVIHVNGGMWSS